MTVFVVDREAYELVDFDRVLFSKRVGIFASRESAVRFIEDDSGANPVDSESGDDDRWVAERSETLFGESFQTESWFIVSEEKVKA